MLQASNRAPTLDGLFNELKRCDQDWLLETLQQRWSHLDASKKASSSRMRGTKRARAPSLDMGHTADPHDLTAVTLLPGRSVSQHVAYFRAFDWASTPLGSMHSWDSTLRRNVNFLLADPRAAVIFWGKHRTMIYNEHYCGILAEKHPWALGRPCSEVWPSTEALDAAFTKGDATGTSSKGDQEQFFIERRGFLEETYGDWSIVPITTGGGSYAYYNIASEVTAQVHYQRQMEMLLYIERCTTESKCQPDFWQNLLKGLECNQFEAPFAILYSSRSSRRPSVASGSDSIVSSNDSRLASKPWGLEGVIGIPVNEIIPSSVDTEWATENISPTFRHAIISGTVETLNLQDSSFSPALQHIAKSRAHGDFCSRAVLIPIGRANGDHGSGFLLLGLNSRRMYDTSYKSFIRLLHRQLASTLISVKAAEDENRRARMSAEMAALDRTLLSEQLEITAQEAKDNERRFRSTAENIPIAMYELSTDGEIVFANQTYFELTGIDPQNLYPYCWVDTIDESQRAVYDAQFELLAAGEAVRFESKLKKKWIAKDLLRSEHIEGETWVLSAAYALRHPDGSVRALQGALIDISRQKWMEGFQDRKLTEAIELKRQQESFMDMVGHEIRNPLSAITLCAGSMMESLEKALEASQDDEVVLKRSDVVSHIENSEIITTCINHQRRIIDDVLTLSKLDSGLLVVAPCEVQPEALIEKSFRMFQGEMEQSNINIKSTTDASYRNEKVNWVLLDPSRLMQVFLNLVSGLLQFSRWETLAD